MKLQLTKEQQTILYAATFYENDAVFQCMLNEIADFVLYYNQLTCVIGDRARELYDAYVKSMITCELINNQQGLSVESVDFNL
jgi:hypothetical protein